MSNLFSYDPAIICTTNTIPQLTIRKIFSRQTCGESNKLHYQTYTIPIFQRRFCWEKPQFQKLLIDITKACLYPLPDEVSMAATNPPISLGRIVVATAKDKVIVIDGQQRLTCVCILLASTRDFINKYLATNQESLDSAFTTSLTTLASFCDNILHPPTALETVPGNSCILEPTYFDRNSFYSCMKNNRHDDGDGSCTLDSGVDLIADHVVQAKMFFDRTFSRGSLLRVIWTKIHRSSDPVDPVSQGSPVFVLSTCASLVQTVLDRICVLYFEVDSKSDVQSVYERLAVREAMLSSGLYNATPGVLMHESDLVRNLITSFSPDVTAQIRMYQQYWTPIERLSAQHLSSTTTTTALSLNISRLDACICSYLRSTLSEECKSAKVIESVADPGSRFFPLYQKLKECIRRSMATHHARDSLSGAAEGGGRGDDHENAVEGVVVALLQDIHTFAVKYFDENNNATACKEEKEDGEAEKCSSTKNSKHSFSLLSSSTSELKTLDGNDDDNEEEEEGCDDTYGVDDDDDDICELGQLASSGGKEVASSLPCRCFQRGTLCTDCIIKKYAPK